MFIRRFFHSPRARRGLALGAVVLSLGGLVLTQAPAGARTIVANPVPATRNGTRFSGPAASGTLALSNSQVLAGDARRVFAELRLRADERANAAERAPLSLVVVLDTSGSMDGDKLREAKRSVQQLLDTMRDSDEVALVRYDSRARVVQSMASVGEVRRSLARRIEALHADGGTNIPDALRQAVGLLRGVQDSRVKRLVLVSDGLDNTRGEAVALARRSVDNGVTVSALGIGLDFDEAYLAEVSRAGHGNFAFVDKPSALARFLNRELKETATTTVRGAYANIRLPRGLRLVRAIGADARSTETGIQLTMGALFAGDERRVVLELSGQLDAGAELALQATVGWATLAGEEVQRDLSALRLSGTLDAAQVERSRDERVYSSAISALASLRQLEATEAFRRGDGARARRLIRDNVVDLREAQQRAPGDMAKGLAVQADGYANTDEEFGRVAPESAAGKAAAKRVWSKENKNTSRRAY